MRRSRRISYNVMARNRCWHRLFWIKTGFMNADRAAKTFNTCSKIPIVRIRAAKRFNRLRRAG